MISSLNCAAVAGQVGGNDRRGVPGVCGKFQQAAGTLIAAIVAMCEFSEHLSSLQTISERLYKDVRGYMKAVTGLLLVGATHSRMLPASIMINMTPVSPCSNGPSKQNDDGQLEGGV